VKFQNVIGAPRARLFQRVCVGQPRSIWPANDDDETAAFDRRNGCRDRDFLMRRATLKTLRPAERPREKGQTRIGVTALIDSRVSSVQRSRNCRGFCPCQLTSQKFFCKLSC
jgi:hypothetical protein